MADDFYGYDDGHEHGGRDNLFLWTVFILLLIGGAFACWLGSLYIFGHPENPRSYKILKKLGKLDPPQRFEDTAAPQGEFLTPQKLYERYAKFTRLELENDNGELIRNFLHNFKDTKRLVTYVTGKFTIIDAKPLEKTDLFPSGVAALAQATDFSQVLIEHIFTSAPRDVNSIKSMLQTGLEMKLAKPDDLSAVIHVERASDGRLLFTVIPLLYRSYALKQGEGQFSLEPPSDMHMEAGLPVIKGAQLAADLKRFAEFRSNHPGIVAETAPEGEKPPPPPELVRLDVPTPEGEKTPLTGALPPVPVVTPIPIAVKPAPNKPASPPKKIAGAKASPSPSASSPGRVATGTKPSPSPSQKLAMAATPISIYHPPASQTPIAIYHPSATPTPVAIYHPPATRSPTGETPGLAEPRATPKVSPSGVPLVPFIAAETNPNQAPTGAAWRTYPPGKAPPAKTIDLGDVATLADKGEIGERMYLRGDFRVTASGVSRAVLRDANKPDDQSPRVLVEFPPGYTPPQERDRVSRDASRPYQIVNVRRGGDGVVTIWVREITQQ